VYEEYVSYEFYKTLKGGLNECWWCTFWASIDITCVKVTE